MIWGKKGQEEMIGFALIVIVVAVILLFFLWFSLNNDSGNGIDSYEANSFIQGFLQYTTTCKQTFDYLDVQDLIFSCLDKEECNDGENSCNVLNSTLKGLTESSWGVGEDSFYKGYDLEINSAQGNIVSIKGGNETNTYKSGKQDFAQSGDSVEIIFRIYAE